MNTLKAVLLFCFTTGAAFADWASTVSDSAMTGKTDGSQSDTQTAVNYVAAKNQDGWVITVGDPGGSYTWGSAVNMPNSMTHSVTMQCAGDPKTNPTKITAGFSPGQLLGLVVTNGHLTQCRGFILDGGGTSHDPVLAIDQTNSVTSVNGFWVEYCTLQNYNGVAVEVLGDNRGNAGGAFGLFDNVTFLSADGANSNGIYNHAGNSDNQWHDNMTWGTTSTVCIEDCTWIKSGNTVEGNPAVDASYNGARYLVRHCTATNWTFVAHGADSAPTSTMQVEFLHNTVNLVTNDSVDFIMYLRGGSMRFFDNAVNLTNGASLNQIVKTACDSSAVPGDPSFEQIGHGALNGVEVLTPVFVWGNRTPDGVTLVGSPNNNSNLWNLNVQYYLADPLTQGQPYKELQYPHPLRNPTVTITSGTVGTHTP